MLLQQGAEAKYGIIIKSLFFSPISPIFEDKNNW